MVAVIVSAPAELDLPAQAALRDIGFNLGQDGQWRGEIDAREWTALERALGLTLDDAGPWT
jgi:hypothetical protein